MEAAILAVGMIIGAVLAYVCDRLTIWAEERDERLGRSVFLSDEEAEQLYGSGREADAHLRYYGPGAVSGTNRRALRVLK